MKKANNLINVSISLRPSAWAESVNDTRNYDQHNHTCINLYYQGLKLFKLDCPVFNKLIFYSNLCYSSYNIKLLE